MPKSALRALPLLAVAAFVAWSSGCGDDPAPTSPALTQDDADGIAQQVGAMLATDNGGLVSLMQGSVPAGAAAKSAGGSPLVTAASETTITFGGITYTLTRVFYDAEGHEMAAYDPILTARMVAASTAHGSIATPRYSATLGHAASLDVTGMATAQDTLRFDGAAYDSLQSSFTSLDGIRTRHFYLESSGTLAGVRFLKPLDPGEWPLSGTVTWSVIADRLRSNDRLDVAAHLDATVVVQFAGTRTVTIVVDRHWSYHVDLKTGFVSRG